jgi:hypothetical protein
MDRQSALQDARTYIVSQGEQKCKPDVDFCAGNSWKSFQAKTCHSILTSILECLLEVVHNRPSAGTAVAGSLPTKQPWNLLKSSVPGCGIRHCANDVRMMCDFLPGLKRRHQCASPQSHYACHGYYPREYDALTSVPRLVSSSEWAPLTSRCRCLVG